MEQRSIQVYAIAAAIFHDVFAAFHAACPGIADGVTDAHAEKETSGLIIHVDGDPPVRYRIQ